MKNVKHLLAGFVIGVVMAIAPSCGAAKNCSASNCPAGCCDASGQCQLGNSNGACGQLGATCQMCAIAQACNFGTCTQSSGNGGGANNGGGTGGGTTGGGNGGGTTGGGTGGGVTGGGTGGGVTGGGTGGGVTGGGTGGGSTCDGCFFNGSCISRLNSNNNTLCGQGGVTCATCSGTQTCVNYVCAGGTGGGTGGGGGVTGGGTGGGGSLPGTVGASCTSTSQCTALGSGAYCKLQTTPFGANAPTPYPSGFCTLPCTGSCPTGAVCAGGVSSFPYLFNEVDRFCTNTCTTATSCGAGFQCRLVEPLTGNPTTGGCFLDISMGTFTGGGNPTKAGNACTTAADCANPPDPVLAACQTGTFPNGYCLANSDFAPPDAWCTGAGKTEQGFPLPDGGSAFYCIGTCTTPGAVGSSRTGYTCYSKSAAEPTVGLLWPKCASNTECANATGMTSCNLTTGFCCDTPTGTVNCAKQFNN